MQYQVSFTSLYIRPWLCALNSNLLFPVPLARLPVSGFLLAKVYAFIACSPCTWKCVPLVDLLNGLLWAGWNGLPPTPDTLHFGCSYHLHYSHCFFFSTWDALMLKKRKFRDSQTNPTRQINVFICSLVSTLNNLRSYIPFNLSRDNQRVRGFSVPSLASLARTLLYLPAKLSRFRSLWIYNHTLTNLCKQNFHNKMYA